MQPALNRALRPGAAGLLAIVKEHDDYGVLARNSGVWVALHGMCALRRAVDTPFPLSNFAGHRRNEPTPTCFLELVTMVLMELRQRQAKLVPPAGYGIKVISDFDLFVFQAVGNALAEVCWPERDGTEFSGPKFERCMERIQAHDETELQWLVLRHYLGNILQSYFEKAGIRLELRDLPAETEVELREVDARQLIEVARAANPGPGNSESIWKTFGILWDELRKVV